MDNTVFTKFSWQYNMRYEDVLKLSKSNFKRIVGVTPIEKYSEVNYNNGLNNNIMM